MMWLGMVWYSVVWCARVWYGRIVKMAQVWYGILRGFIVRKDGIGLVRNWYDIL